MTVMLEVAIGLVFVYLVLSLLASALAEALEHFLRYRADYLRQGVEKLLVGSESLQQTLYRHPLIASLSVPSWFEKVGRSPGPTYIPSRQFALALLDIVMGKPAAPAAPPANQGGAPGQLVAPPSAVERLRTAIDTNAANLPESLQSALRTLVNDAGDDLEKVKANIERWFDGSMDAVAGWYKRRAQFVLLILGTFVAVAVNADTLAIVNTLSNDSTVRAAVVKAAEEHIENTRPQPDPPQEGAPAAPSPEEGGRKPAAGSADAALPARNQTGSESGAQGGNGPKPADQLAKEVRDGVKQAVEQLGSLGLPVGWRRHTDADATASKAQLVADRVLPFEGDATIGDHLSVHLFGWLLTAIAISFGAPFWFDTLNKIMVVRSTVKPREKSPEEGSEDRQPAGGAQTVKIQVVGP